MLRGDDLTRNLSCPGCPISAEILAELADLNAMVARLLPHREPEPLLLALDLLACLAATPGAWFESREALERAAYDRDLAVALEAEGIRTPHGLGRWLGRLEREGGHGVERAGDLWRVSGFTVHETGETDYPVDRCAG